MDSRSRKPAAEKGKSLTFILSLLERERQKSSYGERSADSASTVPCRLSAAGDGGSYNG